MKNIKYLLLLFLGLHTHVSYAMQLSPTEKNIEYYFLYVYYAIKHPSVKMIAHIAPEKKHFVCHDYAFSQALQKIGGLPTITETLHKKFPTILDTCFEKVSDPQPGDLIAYHSRKKNSAGTIESYISHTGIVHNNGLIESKWGGVLISFFTKYMMSLPHTAILLAFIDLTHQKKAALHSKKFLRENKERPK